MTFVKPIEVVIRLGEQERALVERLCAAVEQLAGAIPGSVEELSERVGRIAEAIDEGRFG